MTSIRFAAAAAFALVSSLAVAQTPAKGKLYTRTEDGIVRAVIRIELMGAWHIYHSELGHPKRRNAAKSSAGGRISQRAVTGKGYSRA